jgi:hypothetical protein
MRKLIFSIAALFIAASLTAAELTVQGNSVRFGEQQFVVSKTGTLVFYSGRKQVSNFGVSLATKHESKWFSPGMPVCKPELKTSERGVWDFSARIPADETDFIDLSLQTTVTPFNTIELDYAWETPDRDNILELGVFLTIPMQEIAGKNIIMNGQEFNIVNETQYGWLNKVVENPEITVFKGEPGLEYTASGYGKFKMLFQSGKDQSLLIRFYPLAAEMKLVIIPE